MSNGICVFLVIHSSFIDHNVNSKIIYICSIFSSKNHTERHCFQVKLKPLLLNHHHLTHNWHNYTKPSSTHPKKATSKTFAPNPNHPNPTSSESNRQSESKALKKKKNNQPMGMLKIMSRSFLGCFFSAQEGWYNVDVSSIIYTTNPDVVFLTYTSTNANPLLP